MLIIAVDGRSGAGKTEFARSLARRFGAATISVEDHYAGWGGLDEGIDLVRRVLGELMANNSVTCPAWDWPAGQWGADRTYSPAPVVIVEGVGASETAPDQALRIWLETPEPVRKARALARDGETYAPWWDQWVEQEEQYLLRHDPRSQADAVRHFDGVAE